MNLLGVGPLEAFLALVVALTALRPERLAEQVARAIQRLFDKGRP